MTQADQIREFVLARYIVPARSTPGFRVRVRAGDVHHAMGLQNALPAVCSALDSGKFHALASVECVSRNGPRNGSNVLYEFQQQGAAPSATEFSWEAPYQPPERATANVAVGLENAVVLVSCVKSKLEFAAEAKSLYTSPWFVKVRSLVEAAEADWCIISSRYGVVEPNEVIAPYDFTLNTLGVAERRRWASKVLTKLEPKLCRARKVVFFAGARYREFLVTPIRRRGLRVDIPMENLRRGEQLAWLSRYV